MDSICVGICFLLVLETAAIPQNNDKIIGGEDAEEGSRPFQISVQMFDFHTCGGAIIAKDWILTAAYCVSDVQGSRITPSDWTIVAGTNSLSQGGTKYKAIEVHMHEGYDVASSANNIALLKVESIEFNRKVAPIVVEREYARGGVPCSFAGWGETVHPGNHADKLQTINSTIITFEECARRHLTPIITERNVCAFTRDGEGICYGDYGGPLVVKRDGVRKVAGIASWGRACAVGVPDVFTRTSMYIDWINDKCNHCLDQ